MNHRRHTSTGLFLLGLLTAAPWGVGCGGDDTTSISIANRGASAPAPTPTPTPAAGSAVPGGPADQTEGKEEQELLSFIHEESNTYRDPFRYFLKELDKPQVKPGEEVVPQTPTEAYDVGEFKVIGIITGTPVPKAMVTDPTGFGHVIRPGDRMGKQGGRVVAIYSNVVVVQGNAGAAEETLLYLTPPGQEQDLYRVNVVESVIEQEAAKRQKAAAAGKPLMDLQQLLGQSGGGAEAGATAAAGATTPSTPADLPAVPVLPLLPGFMIQQPGAGFGPGGETSP